MEGFSRTSEKNRDGGNDPDSKDTGKGTSSSEVDNSDNAPEDNVTVPEHESSKVELHEITEKSRVATGLEDHPGGVTDTIPIPSARSSKEIKVGETSGSPDMRSDRDSSERKIELSSPSATETSTSSTGKTKSFPRILGGVRREREISREMLDTIADMPQRPFEISVSMQTDASWIHDHVYKREPPLTAPKETQKEIPPENDIYAVIPQDLSCLDILCDTEFREDFLKLFQESLQTISSVGPPTILAYRPESSRADIHIEVQKETPETCEFCGSPLIYFPSFESLEHIAEWGDLFCCQQCRDLHEFIVSEKNRYPKKMEMIDIAPHKAHGSQADRERAKERARQRLRERQMAKQIAFMAVEAEKSAFPMHIPEYNKQLKTISFFLSQETPSSARIYPPVIKEAEIVDNTYSISCCDFTIAGGKLVKNQFIQQYYKNGVKFLTMFPDGTAQIFYPSGNLAIIVVQKDENAGYICIVQEDKCEKPEIQAVFDSCGKGTCYHPNQIVWINITIRGGHYSDQAGNKVKTWIWPNNLQKHNPRVSFKPIFLSLNLNVGVRILGQDKIAISFLAMGKQAKINVGTKVKPLAEHLPWPKYIAEDDLLLFANRLKILRIFAKLNGYLDFPASDWWTKLELPSFLLKQTSKLIYLCKECEIDCALDKLIMAKLNSPV
ncbi:glutamate-rich protein 6 isoform X2 [Crotalus tigris]|uniref:glutamate-rich protein 6 isoform X2 n=1 Tax=Crotalus tigris TaxID=88082 RepID=UPI00192F5D2E|nr:glutamate-rich protein 6 isoform X2 [Crotalus tigris]